MLIPLPGLVHRARQPSAGAGRSPAGVALLTLQALALVVLAATVATKSWQQHIWFGWLLVAVTCFIWSPELRRSRDRRWWLLYVAGIFVYTLLRSYADDTGMPIQAPYVIHIDHFLFFGNDPTVWLQQHLFSTSRVTALDILAVQVHWSFFVAPHAAAVLIFFWKRQLFPRYVLVVVGTMYAALAVFFVAPTAPPWLAAREGLLPGAFRIMDFVGGKVNSDAYRSLSSSLGEPNPVAAMPSVHMAVTFAMYLWVRDYVPRIAPWLLAYCVVMGLALVYLAEHYVVDLGAGVLCALICHLSVRHFAAVPEPAAAAGALPRPATGAPVEA